MTQHLTRPVDEFDDIESVDAAISQTVERLESLRDRRERLLYDSRTDLFSALAATVRESPSGIERDALVDILVEAGHDRDRVTDVLDELQARGELYEAGGRVKPVVHGA